MRKAIGIKTYFTRIGKSDGQITAFDWLLFGCMGFFAFFVFNHIDLLATAQHSYAFLDGHFLDFYSSCYEMNDTYSANYFPLTFIIFAIWNLPLKMLGMEPAFWGDWDNIFIFWNKLLPVSMYMLSAMVLYKLCSEEFGIEKNKSKMVMYIFITAPVGFFSQFMFCQYDIFTVFCMLIGMRFYFKKNRTEKDWYLFAFWFGIAVSFKYHAVLAFIVFLFIREKKVGKILLSAIVMVIPCAVQFIIYSIFDKEAFTAAVFGFSVLEYVDTTSAISIGFASIKLLPLAICCIAAAAYFASPRDQKEEISYTIYYTCGMFFALFSFMTWHPQWLLLAVPFWVLGCCLNRKYQILFWLDILFFAVFVIFIANNFRYGVDQELLKNGILSSALQFCIPIERTMSDLFVYSDVDMLFSVLVALFAILFFYNHPRFHFENMSAPLGGTRWLLRMRFIGSLLLFIVPALVLLPDLLHAPERLWSQYELKEVKEVAVGKRGNIVQYATVPGDSITDVFVKTRLGTYDGIKKQSLIMEIYDVEMGELIATSELKGEDIVDGGLSHFEVTGASVQPGNQYAFVFKTTKGYQMPVYIFYGTCDQPRNILYDTVQKDYSEDYIEIKEEKYDMDNTHIIYQIYGHYRK